MGYSGNDPAFFTIPDSIQKSTWESETSFMQPYLDCIKNGEFSADPDQYQVMLELQRVYDELLCQCADRDIKLSQFSTKSRLSRIFPVANNRKKITPVKGLYLWGGVGRGKTHLVNYFYQQLPTHKKLRLHFHRFMQLIHDEMANLEGISDPLKFIADDFALKTDIIFLDEMHVNDITDAMLLGKLFDYLFENGVTMVFTSNIAPENLYKDGLQRARFIPAIRLIEKHNHIMQVGGQTDYRLKTLEQNGVYHLSSGQFSEQRLENYFHQLAGVELHRERKDIIINHRKIAVKMWADGIVWFSFDALCNTHRATQDYTQIACYFHTVLISDIPVMDDSMDDAARRFVSMIDEFYDVHVNLVVSAQDEPEKLYAGDRIKAEYQRTASRLREMQSRKYMAATHLS